MNIHECESSPFAMPYSDFIEKYLAIPVQPGLYSLDLENSDLDSSSASVLDCAGTTDFYSNAQKLGGCLMKLTPHPCVSNMFVFLLVTCRAHGTTCRIHLAGPIHGEHCRTSWEKKMIQIHLVFRYAFHMFKKLQKHG